MISPARLLALARKETIHVVRDWRSLVLVIAIPMVLIVLFGYALDMDLKKVPTVVWDQSRTPESREFLSLFDGSPYFALTRHASSYREIQQAVDAGRAIMALVIPADFSVKILGSSDVSVQLIVDGSDANTARLAWNYAAALAQIYSLRVNVERAGLMGSEGLAVPVELVHRAWYNQDLRSQNYIIPGILAVVMMVIATMMTSITVAREWETGTMEQLISTPVRGPEIVFGKVIPYFVIGLVDVAIAVAMGQWIFDVPLRGSPALIFAVASIFLAGALFFGLTVSIVTKAQVLANQIALLSGFLPTMLLSGFVFAIENMPLPIQVLTYIVPARYFIELLRGIYLKGIGLEVMWLNAVLLSIYALIMAAAANAKMKLVLE